jgi:hypothetical protein
MTSVRVGRRRSQQHVHHQKRFPPRYCRNTFTPYSSGSPFKPGHFAKASGPELHVAWLFVLQPPRNVSPTKARLRRRSTRRPSSITTIACCRQCAMSPTHFSDRLCNIPTPRQSALDAVTSKKRGAGGDQHQAHADISLTYGYSTEPCHVFFVSPNYGSFVTYSDKVRSLFPQSIPIEYSSSVLAIVCRRHPL